MKLQRLNYNVYRSYFLRNTCTSHMLISKKGKHPFGSSRVRILKEAWSRGEKNWLQRIIKLKKKREQGFQDSQTKKVEFCQQGERRTYFSAPVSQKIKTWWVTCPHADHRGGQTFSYLNSRSYPRASFDSTQKFSPCEEHSRKHNC